MPSNGFDITLGLDGGLQQYAEQLLKGYHGAVVAIDPSNGEILAMASAPDYDPAVFSGVTSREEYAKLANDPAKPLLNRATQAAYPPGSTWKPLMSIAGLTEGLIKPNTVVSCPGSFTYGGRTWKCDAVHGTLAVRRAIQASCDVFFYKLGLAMGIDTYNKWGKLFHFGEKSGLDFDETNWTNLPSREYYDKHFGKDKWPKGVMVNLGIGQGELLVSPLQLASYCATIADGGVWHQPHLIRYHTNNQLGTKEMFQYETEDLHLRRDILDLVRGGMFDVVNVPGGTAYGIHDDSLQIAGKTGTAQAPGHQFGAKDHSWFISFAPFNAPKIAMCVLVENSGFGSQFAAPITHKLIRYYLTRQKAPEDIRPDDYNQEDRRLQAAQMPGADSAQGRVNAGHAAKPSAPRPKGTSPAGTHHDAAPARPAAAVVPTRRTRLAQ
jgi:penicillin-binding protein 2